MTEQANKIEQAKAQRDSLIIRIGETRDRLKNKKIALEEIIRLEELKKLEEINLKKAEEEKLNKQAENPKATLNANELDSMKNQEKVEIDKNANEVNNLTISEETIEVIEEPQVKSTKPEIVSGVTVYYPQNTNNKPKFKPISSPNEETKQTYGGNKTKDYGKTDINVPPLPPGKIPSKLVIPKKSTHTDVDVETKEINKKARLKFGAWESKNTYLEEEDTIVKFRTKKTSSKKSLNLIYRKQR